MVPAVQESIALALEPLLAALRAQQPGALDAVILATQQDLRRIARRERLDGGAGETLSTTALVNEAYLRLSRSGLPSDVDRRLFFGAAARVMRQVLVDHARTTHAQKRGGGVQHESLSAALGTAAPEAQPIEWLALDQALEDLAAANLRAAEVVQLRFFAGLGDAEISNLLGIDESTVRRDWAKARGWLYQRLADGHSA